MSSFSWDMKGEMTVLGSELFHIRNLAIGRGGKRLSSNLHLAIQSGQRVGIFGSNGVGKTTFLRTVLGLESPISGVITFRGVHVARGLSAKARQAIGYLPQRLTTVPELTLSDFYAATWHARCRGDLAAKISALDGALEHVQLLDKQDVTLSALSGGELRRALFGALLIIQPECCILDEPTAALDPHAEEEMKDVLLRVEAPLFHSGLIVSHDKKFLHSTCQRVFELTPEGLLATECAAIQGTEGVLR